MLVGSASVLKERGNAADSASVPNERKKGFSLSYAFLPEAADTA